MFGSMAVREALICDLLVTEPTDGLVRPSSSESRLDWPISGVETETQSFLSILLETGGEAAGYDEKLTRCRQISRILLTSREHFPTRHRARLT